ncbi:MAG: diphthine--ammonia ligase [Promethearchaeota archaeon]
MDSAIVSWSGGKDSALALYYLLLEKRYTIKKLITTISTDYDRISMHGVRKELLEKQSQSMGISVYIISLQKDVSNAEYEEIMRKEMNKFKSQQVGNVVFGDIFLEDIRKYRESNLSKIGMNALFPIWGKSTRDLAKKFLKFGFEAIITCVDSTVLDGSFIGQLYNEDFLASIPPNIDPCGENGEFHTFVFNGPIFSYPIQFTKGNVVFREDRFYFIDLIPQ